LLRGNIEEALSLAGKSETHFTAIGHYKATVVREWRQSQIPAGSRSRMYLVIDEETYGILRKENMPTSKMIAVA